jgi:AICAR transformylase/IMP cyclohydrolase PurH
MSETEKDATNAFAGLIALNSNIDEETKILVEIEQILSDNGI